MIIFPMAGLSRRFFEAGYNQPKYRLLAHGHSLLFHAVKGFVDAYRTERFVFAMLAEREDEHFIRSEAYSAGVDNIEVVLLPSQTLGQADTVAQAIERLAKPDDSRLTIFNIDTFRPYFQHPLSFDRCSVDGYLEVFHGTGANWSFVEPMGHSDRVRRTTEKVPISNLCSTGLYEFRSSSIFLESFQVMRSAAPETWANKELYVAPLYNHLIENGADIRFRVIESNEVIFCGIPSEYESFQKASSL